MVIFRNAGTLIDLRAIRSFGASAKVVDNPIGMWGSGLKHAIALLLRTSHTITLYRGLDRYTFGTVKATMRDKDFDFITLVHPDGREEELPFTTDLGKSWNETWMAYRELHANALDENGETIHLEPTHRFLRQIEPVYTPRENETAFVVTGPEIDAIHATRDEIFLPRDLPRLFTHGKVEVIARPGLHVYYRGVRVKQLPRPSLYTYNLTSLSYGLTEDRTLKSDYDFEWPVAAAIAQCPNEQYLRTVLVAHPTATFEGGLDDYSSGAPNELFSRVYSEYRGSGRLVDLTELANAVWKKGGHKPPLPDAIEPTKIQRMQLDRAISFAKRVGYPVDEYPIIVIPKAASGLLALAEDGKIVLTLGVFEGGTKTVTHAVIEEWMHLKHGFNDMTRDFQSYLFTQLIGKCEELTGEAL